MNRKQRRKLENVKRLASMEKTPMQKSYDAMIQQQNSGKSTTDSKNFRQQIHTEKCKQTGHIYALVERNGLRVRNTEMDMVFGRTRPQRTVENPDSKPFKQQSDRVRTKHTHLNAHYRVRGAVAVSGGLVDNEFTTNVHDAIEMEMGTL